MKKQRLTINDRVNIQAGIAKGFTLQKIANIIRVNRSTIYREIINNCYYRRTTDSCKKCTVRCSKETQQFYNLRGKTCEYFQPRFCDRWSKFPYTCNGCEKHLNCWLVHRYYDCVVAHEKALETRSASRVYRKINYYQLMVINDIVSKGILKGQSLHHIYCANPELETLCSERTIRRYLYKDYLSVKPHELPRYVRYNRSYSKKTKRKSLINPGRLFGRTFDDFKTYLEEHEGVNVWQLDSVIGKVKDKKAILTITCPSTNFQFGFLVNKAKTNTALDALKELRRIFGADFGNIFQVFLADNGMEFVNLDSLEEDENGEIVTRVFFTNPYKSTDKSECERNHEFIRYVIPKHTTLDCFSQSDIALLFSHINSYYRKSKQNKTPYQLMKKRFGVEFLSKIGINHINEKSVNLKPSLLK